MPSAWLVLQVPSGEYQDVEGQAYHYPLRTVDSTGLWTGHSIPNSGQIQKGDYIVASRTAKTAEGDGRLFGVGEVGDVVQGVGSATAWYSHYAALEPWVSFAEAGGDPRTNQTNAINRVPMEWVDAVLAARQLTRSDLPSVGERRPPESKAIADKAHAPAPVVPNELPSLLWLEQKTLWDASRLKDVINTVTGRTRQVALAGPPGTGKTWVAQHIARHLTGGTPDRVRTVQFHPSYSYEQFMEGLRPVVKPGGGIQFERVDGVILELAKEMRQRSGRRVLVIDEMNRANLPRVFGELMYLFEYRQDPIRLQYSDSFALPEELLVIGTMNTADRSIRGIDLALRRRFDIFECPPDVDILEKYYRSHTMLSLTCLRVLSD
ncbi:MAG: AAA family ATPase [Chloroflexota bacterium]